MGRFADAAKTRRVGLGACECPGAPHDEDYALVRSELSAHEISRFTGADAEDVAEVAAGFIPSWNLLGNDGRPMPVSAAALLSMMAPTLNLLTDAIAESIGQSVTLPNASGDPSPSGSQANGSQPPAVLTPT